MMQTEIHLHQTPTSTPEQFIAGLTDFGPGRSKLFGNSANEYLKVHHRGRSEANVTEGSGGIRERLHYGWSDPNRVILTTTNSNVWGGASAHTHTFTRQPNGTTDIDVVVVREGTRTAQSKGTKKDKNVIESALVGGEPLHQRRASVVTLLLASDRVANKESSGRLIAGEERTNNGSF
jgi:hypothetical protein